MSGIEHEYLLNAITALAFYQARDGLLLVLAGEGCFLKIFDALSSDFIAQCRIFEAQTIHGISILDQETQFGTIKAAFWGGRSFTLLNLKELEAIVEGKVINISSSESIGPDWILDGAISPFFSSSTCLFVTAHNAALRAVKEDGSESATWKLLPSLSPLILYSAHSLWISRGSIMVAGGTVFGDVEVNVWEDVVDDALVCSHHMYTFTGHEGSVFGVRISPEIKCQDGSKTRYLASCSDDRTIRVWDLSSPASDQNSSETGLNMNKLIRETGFGEKDSNPMAEFPTTRCIALKMAHASRIWRVDFITWNRSVQFTNDVHLLSFGEDSTCQHWALEFSRQDRKVDSPRSSLRYPALLIHLNTFSYHSGKHIWSSALSSIGNTLKHLVTGGADGKLAIYGIFLEAFGKTQLMETENLLARGAKTSTKETLPIISRSWNLSDIIRDSTTRNKILIEFLPLVERRSAVSETAGTPGVIISFVQNIHNTATTIKDAPNRYGFVGENEVLVTSSLGRLFYTLIAESCEWEELELPEMVTSNLKSYSIILGMPKFCVALLAGANGMIYIYHKKVVTELLKLHGKPAALFSVSNPDEDRLSVIITTLGSDTAHQVSINTSGQQSPSLAETIPIKIPSGFVVTSIGITMTLLILGARNGSIAFYDLENSREAMEIVPGQEVQSDDAVTSVTAIPSTGSQTEQIYFVTTNRNGSYSIFSISMRSDPEKHKTIAVQLVHRAFPPLGPMIEYAWFIESDLILYGFCGTSFVVWNETSQCEISSIECGGGHRSYDYMPFANRGGAGHFAYTKASRLHIHSQAHPSHTALKSGGHGREIKAAAIHGKYIATGAEDTIIRIWRICKESGERRKTFITVDGVSGNNGNTSLECCAVLEKHTTGVQHLQWCCSSEDYHSLFSAGGAEEFHVWAISDIPGFGVGVICEATLEDLSEDRDLRILGFDAELVHDNRSHKSEHQGGPRGKNVITIVYSDSTIRRYEYSRTLGFQRVAEGKYTSACLTNVICLQTSKASQKFFTTSTDGYLVLWELLSRSNAEIGTFSNQSPAEKRLVTQIQEISLIIRFKVHQSSISALAIQHLTLLPQNGGLLVATAGDDNALCVIFFNNLTPVKRIKIPSAHAAGITGLAFRSDMTGGPLEYKWVQLWTVGGDQRVKRWTIEFGVTDLEPKPTMENGLNMRILGQDESDDVWSSVADPGGLVEWRDNWEEDHALVYGNGMEIFRLKDGFPDGTGSRWVEYIKEKPIQAMQDKEWTNR